MCGLLSGGAWGDGVKGMYDDPAKPLDCAHLFIAIDVAHFGDIEAFKRDASAAVTRVQESKRAPGVERITVPGERKWEQRRASAERVRLAPAVNEALTRLEKELGLSAE
jgi:LDH2 family malate/lactate/ureidoglycolate dehydrogenase